MIDEIKSKEEKLLKLKSKVRKHPRFAVLMILRRETKPDGI